MNPNVDNNTESLDTVDTLFEDNNNQNNTSLDNNIPVQEPEIINQESNPALDNEQPVSNTVSPLNSTLNNQPKVNDAVINENDASFSQDVRIDDKKLIIGSVICFAIAVFNYLVLGPRVILVIYMNILKFLYSTVHLTLTPTIWSFITTITILGYFTFSLILCGYFLYSLITKGQGLLAIKEVIKKIAIYSLLLSLIFIGIKIIFHNNIGEAYTRVVSVNGKLIESLYKGLDIEYYF